MNAAEAAELTAVLHPCLAMSIHNAFSGSTQKSLRRGLTLYAVLRELQKILATWTGACSICGQSIPAPQPHQRT